MATVIKDKHYRQKPTKSDIFRHNACHMKKGLDGFWRPTNHFAFWSFISSTSPFYSVFSFKLVNL